MSAFWLWTGVLGHALGAIIFGIGARNARTQQWQILLVLNFFICLIASGLYLAMALGQGFSIIYERPTYWVRYITWSLSTPLLILVLAFLGRSSLPLAGGLLGADIYMIATGFVATISPKPINYIWYLVSCGAYIAIIFLLLKPYRTQAIAHHPRAGKAFTQLITVHLVLWTLYPVVWILSTTGFNLLSSGVETMSYALLDLASKVGFGLLSLNTLAKLERLDENYATSNRQESVQLRR